MAGPHTRRIDLGGRVVVAGFNDAHYHPYLDVAGRRLKVQGQEPSWNEITRELKIAIASVPKGTFIFADIGAEVFETAEATRSSLDTLAPDHPVFLMGWTGHFAILNTAALRKVGITEDQPDPLGGRFVRGPDGRLTGLSVEYATVNISRALNAMVADADAVEQLHPFFDEAVRLGITSVQNMAIPIDADRLVVLLSKAQTPIRMRVMRFPPTDEHRRLTEKGHDLPRSPSPFITVSGTKYVLDGSPIERSCAMRQPYADDPSTSGWMDFSERDMEAMLRESLTQNDQLLVHIVGDRTLETFLNAMDATGGKAVWSKRRVRVEHGEGIMPDLVPRVRDLGLVVVQNPTHFDLSDLMHRRFSPEVVAHYQPLRSLLDAGIPVALGSDGPINPYLNVMLASNVPGRPGESIMREQAVIAYTLTSAYAEFAEKDNLATPIRRAESFTMCQTALAVNGSADVFPILLTRQKILPRSIPAAASQFANSFWTQSGMGTVWTWPALPTMSTMAQCSSRRCRSSTFNATISCLRKPPASRRLSIARSRFPISRSALGACHRACPCSAVSQFPSRTPRFFTPLTRRIPAARSALSNPQSGPRMPAAAPRQDED